MASSFSLAQIPAVAPPPGVRSNFVDPVSRAPVITSLDGVFISLMLVAVAVRVFIRVRGTRGWGWDDYACLLAACGSVTHMIVYTQMIKVGYGRHLWDIRAVDLLSTQNSRTLSANGIVYPFTIFFTKLSILLLYLHVFGVDLRLRHAIYFGIVFQALFYTAMIGLAIGAIVQCNGTSQLRNRFCINYSRPVVLLNAAVNVATDLYVLALPVGRVLKLQLSFGRKLGLLVIFAAGIATCAASLARLIVFATNFHDPDILWIQARNSEFTIVEMNVAIIVACISTFPAFFAKCKGFTSTIYQTLRTRPSASHVGASGSDVTASDRGDGVIVGKLAAGLRAKRKERPGQGRWVQLREVKSGVKGGGVARGEERSTV